MWVIITPANEESFISSYPICLPFISFFVVVLFDWLELTVSCGIAVVSGIFTSFSILAGKHCLSPLTMMVVVVFLAILVFSLDRNICIDLIYPSF